MLPIGRSDVITALLAVKDFTESDYLLMLTADGMIKKTPLGRFEKMQASGLTAIKMRVQTQSCRCPGRLLVQALHSVMSHDMQSRYPVALQDGDTLRWVDMCTAESSVIVASSCGRGIHFRTDEAQLRTTGRGSGGIRV